MKTEIRVPVLGESVSEATVAAWLHQVGDRVEVDEPLVELETDKATLEVGAPKAGILIEIVVGEGEDVAVGGVLGFLEDASGAEPPSPTSVEPPEPESQRAAPGAAPAAEAARTEPAAAGLDPTRVPRRGPQGKVTAADFRAFIGATEGTAEGRSGPAARKLLADHGLDAASLEGSGRGGRVTQGDVLERITGSALPAQAREGASATAREERVRMSRLRRTLARRLKGAQDTAAILTTFNEVDMQAVRALRTRYQEAFEKKHGVRLGFMSFFAKAAVAGLREFPVVNAEVDGDEIVYKYHYDIGMAVSAPQGLVVPVVRDCDQKSFAEIEASLGELAARAREGKLTTEEMSGGTFTISNGGVFGSLLSTPILNPPQSGILGLHKIEDRPVAVEGSVEIRPMMYLALSYDHRIVDGREAVRFLVRVKEAIEDPERLLLEV